MDTDEFDPCECPVCGRPVSDEYPFGDSACENCDDIRHTESRGPDEGDITTTDCEHFYQYGKLYLNTSIETWEYYLLSKMIDDGYFPNVFTVSDHGNTCLLTDWCERGRLLIDAVEKLSTMEPIELAKLHMANLNPPERERYDNDPACMLDDYGDIEDLALDYAMLLNDNDLRKLQ